MLHTGSTPHWGLALGTDKHYAPPDLPQFYHLNLWSRETARLTV